MDFFLSYEGVHEVCPLCGAKDYSLVSCPKKPKNTMELVVAQFEASNLDHSNIAPSSSDWIHVRPQRRARPRVFQGSSRPRRGSFKNSLPRSSPVPIVPSSHVPRSPSLDRVSHPSCGDAVVPTSNIFSALGDFQVTSGAGIDLNPGLSNTVVLPDSSINEEADLEEDFIAALGIIHHNPNVNFDAEMSLCSSDDEACSENSKRRKREEMEASSIFSPSP